MSGARALLGDPMLEVAKEPTITRDFVLNSLQTQGVPDHCLVAGNYRLSDFLFNQINDVEGSKRSTADEHGISVRPIDRFCKTINIVRSNSHHIGVILNV